MKFSGQRGTIAFLLTMAISAFANAADLAASHKAIVVLTSVDKNGKVQSSGTGFFISEDGVIVTARHIAQAGEKLAAITHDGKMRRVTGFIGENRDNDIAIIKIEGTNCHPLALKLALPSVETSVTLASPASNWIELFLTSNSIPIEFATGKVLETPELVPGFLRVIITSVQTRKGKSGSPLLNNKGEVVGIAPYISSAETATIVPSLLIHKIASQAVVPFDKRPKTATSVPLLFDADFRSGLKALANKDWKKVTRAMKKASRKFPESAVPLVLSSVAQASQRQFKDAKKFCQKAIAMEPLNPKVRWLYGEVLFNLKNNSEAIVQMHKAIDYSETEADTVPYWSLIAKAEFDLGNSEASNRAIKEVELRNSVAAADLRKLLRQPE